jgi:flavodoxin I
MKLVSSILLACAVSTANGFGVSRTTNAFTRQVTTELYSTGIYYSTQTGNTETVCSYLADAAGIESYNDIGDASEDELAGHDSFIVGAPTWHTGADDQRSGTSWDEWLYDTLPNVDMKGKKVAIFGVGDQESYSENYCDAAGELYDLFKGAGATICGFTPTDGYGHDESKAEVDGKFVGCMFDEDNQYDMSKQRATDWVAQLKTEGFF